MSLKNEINEEIRQAFDTDLADAVTDFTATRQSNDDWVINDNGTPTEAYTGRGVFGSYSAYETDGQAIGIHDVKLICLQSEVTGMPMIDDVINDMRVLSIAKDPANATWVMQLRGLSDGHEVG
ncbi:glutamate 5-kinase [Moraxella sp. Tifton1]|uniref:glutamate 5-kinase n=1 Tax=Moraxella oculi TaxID=2940516 RepID=UPI0020121282|nr:glutamate 5-kinase [Moraxella sp. Tifton1]MCL1623820.1 glutamate 5-kinase [Moraxella sp. Tifton1]